jgi:hypothetical protein
MTEKKNFWSTVPGVVTGLATILTATLGIVSLVRGNGNEAASPQPTESASPTTSSTNGSSSGTGGRSSGGGGGSGTAAPRAVVAPKSLNFGQLGSGRSRELTVTVANSGDEYLVVDGVEISGRNDVFAAEGRECLQQRTGVAPDDDCEITVTFTPTAPGAFAGFLEIEHSANDSPARVALNGDGVLLDL